MNDLAVIKHLVQRFEDNLASYRAGHYNETQLRREFLDPFFEALGWDVFNKQGYAEAYKDVIHEDAIKVAGGTRAPDYAFRIGARANSLWKPRNRLSISKTISARPSSCGVMPGRPSCRFRILTDFEEFAVYDCRSKPDRSDKASTGRLMMLTYQRLPAEVGRDRRHLLA